MVDETTPPDAVEAFLARSDTRQDPAEPHRVFVDGTKVEILPVRPLDDSVLNGISPNDVKRPGFSGGSRVPWVSRGQLA